MANPFERKRCRPDFPLSHYIAMAKLESEQWDMTAAMDRLEGHLERGDYEAASKAIDRIGELMRRWTEPDGAANG